MEFLIMNAPQSLIKQRNKKAFNKAEDYLRSQPFNRWIYFSKRPDLFNELFQIIDENWLYCEFNTIIDDDENGSCFKKVGWMSISTRELVYPDNDVSKGLLISFCKRMFHFNLDV